jgi:hypothetical protein
MTSLFYIADVSIWGLIGISKITYNLIYYSIYGERKFEQKVHNLTSDDFDKLKEIIYNVKKEPLEIQPETKGITIDTD